jgi:hypothetical protein
MEKVFDQFAFAKKRVREFESESRNGSQNVRGFKSRHLITYLSRYAIFLEQRLEIAEEDRKFVEEVLHQLEGRVEELERDLKRKKEGADTLASLANNE